MSDELYSRTCPICSTVYRKGINTSKRMWSERYKACSTRCAAKLRGAPWLEKFKLKPGAQLGKATRFTSDRTTGANNAKWKGDNASYTAKHIWIKYHYGKADHCEDCGDDSERMYHWSNISGEYLRDRNDWQQLCVPCHKRYDLVTK